jgi:hypothetical protein
LTLGSLDSLDVLDLDRLTSLKRLKLGSFCHHSLKEVPDLARLTALQELTIEECGNLTLLLQELTIRCSNLKLLAPTRRPTHSSPRSRASRVMLCV